MSLLEAPPNSGPAEGQRGEVESEAGRSSRRLQLGFFGIGGGFLIVPGLIASTGMPMINAVGSSLVAVTAFGLTTAANYALSGLVDWLLAFAFIAGGLIGSFAGARLAKRLAGVGHLSSVFAALIFVVAVYVLWKSGSAFL